MFHRHTARQPDRDSQVRHGIAQPPLRHPHPPAVVVDVPRRNPAPRLPGKFHRAVHQRRRRGQVALLQPQPPQAAIRHIQRQVIQLADPVGLQQRRLRPGQFAALQVFLAQTVPSDRVEVEIACPVGRFDAFIEELPRLRHPVLARAQGSQLDQDLAVRLIRSVGVESLNRALDPFGGRIQFAQFRVEGCDIDVETCGSAAVVDRLRLVVRFQERLQGRPVPVQGELAGADVAQGARCFARHMGFDGHRPRGFKSRKRFLVTSSLEEPGCYPRKGIRRSGAYRCAAFGCQIVRSGLRSGS